LTAIRERTHWLEVNVMHVLHHPDRRPVLLVTVLAAALAIIVSLVLATSLSRVKPGAASAGSRASVGLQPSAARATHTSNLLNGNPLTGLLGAPIHLPWASARPFAPRTR
jgi:hypothetical protein